jgi:mRNA interferase MazF
LLRIPLDPNAANGLTDPRNIVADKVTTMPRSKLSERIGKVSDENMRALSRRLVVFLGVA